MDDLLYSLTYEPLRVAVHESFDPDGTILYQSLSVLAAVFPSIVVVEALIVPTFSAPEILPFVAFADSVYVVSAKTMPGIMPTHKTASAKRNELAKAPLCASVHISATGFSQLQILILPSPFTKRFLLRKTSCSRQVTNLGISYMIAPSGPRWRNHLHPPVFILPKHCHCADCVTCSVIFALPKVPVIVAVRLADDVLAVTE